MAPHRRFGLRRERPETCTYAPAEMDALVRIRAGGREIECGLATTRRERAAVLAQRFRVYQRRGYYRPDLRADRDAHDARAPYFVATLCDGTGSRYLLGSARLILGDPRAGFRFPVDEAFEFELPTAIRETAISQRVEVTRVVAESSTATPRARLGFRCDGIG